MKKISIFLTLFLCIAYWMVYADDAIKGPLPEKLPPPEKCSACHDVPQTLKELSISAHKNLKCLECHIPGGVQKIKYEIKDCGFFRLGYHEKDGNWIETKESEVCLRCHTDKEKKNIVEKCWSCHMPQNGVDKIRILKNKNEPPTPDNIREVKEIPHRSHTFTYH